MAKRPAKRTAARSKRPVAVKVEADPAGYRYLDVGAVLAGAVVALAISTVLFQFGGTVGLAIDAPLRGEGRDAAMGLIASGIWLLWVPLISAMAGGYVAGAMRGRSPTASEREVEMRDGIHGLCVWAVATLGAAAGAAVIAAIAALGTDAAGATATNVSEELLEKAAIVFGFVTAAASALSAGVAWWAATLGGNHRDNDIDVYMYVPRFNR